MTEPRARANDAADQVQAARDKLAADLESVRRELLVISACTWGVAVGVMIYGLGNVTGLLLHHDVPAGVAWILSPMVDAGLCVGLIGTRGLARHGQRAGWVGALRWITALMTWMLNIATPLTHPLSPDWLGVFIHSVGPVLLWCVVEAAANYQHRMALVIATKQRALEGLETKVRTDRAERTELTRRLGEAVSRSETLAVELEKSTSERDTLAASLEAVARDAENATQTLRTEIAETISTLTAQHAEELDRLRAETSTVNLTDYRNTRSRGGAAGKRNAGGRHAPPRRLTDEEAVQVLLAVNPDPNHEWSQPQIREATGAGGERLKRLQQLVAEHHRRCAAERPKGRSGEASEPDDEQERELALASV